MEDNQGEIIIYQSEDGLTHIDVRIEDETVWLTQAQLVELYQTSKSMTAFVQKKQVPHIAAPARMVCPFAVLRCLQCAVHRSVVAPPLF